MIDRTRAKLALVGILAIASLCTYDRTLIDVSDVMDSMMNRGLARRRGNKVKKPRRKRLIWLMGYPHSGVDETMNLVEHSTQLSMGTNYGDVMQTANLKSHYAKYPSESIQEEWFDTGPFKNNVDFPVTPDNVLVKTYCSGYCLFEEDCGRIDYVRNMRSLKRWWQACAKPQSYDPTRKKPVLGEKAYLKNAVKHVVITTRNPIDIVTSRYKEYTIGKSEFPFNSNGFYKWCEMVDEERGGTKEIKNYLKKKYIRKVIKKGILDVKSIPCYTEFMRIFWFYENVMGLTARRHQKYFMRYTQLKHRYRKITPGLLEFIGLKEVKSGDKFFSGDAYDAEFYTAEDKEKIAAFYELLSRKGKAKSWTLFSEFFG